jgi:lipoprotein-anchoring transpeptidase ErfK/SrfK
MKTTILALGIAAAILSAGSAGAALPEREPAPQPAATADEPLRLAQARDVEVVIDQNGRELLIDSRTGQILAIRQRGLEPQSAPYERRRQRAIELNRDGYPDRDLLLGERLDRELETRLGMREPPQSREEIREFRRMQRERYPRDGYPVEGWSVEPDDDTYVSRGELPPPDEDDVAAFPEAPGVPTIVAPPQPEAPTVVPPAAGATDQVARIQILLDRYGASPGVIDGRMGDNVNKAIAAWRDMTGIALRTYDDVAIEAALAETGGDAFTTYEITPMDAAGPFVASVPEDYGEKAKLDRLGFVTVSEMLAERFHMDEKYLISINPGIDFSKPGSIVKVANTGANITAKVARIVADKGRKQVRGYDETGKLVVAYPATIGSSDTPSPTGSHTVQRIAFDPEYTYNPKINFKQGDNDKVLRIPPGPNGPVGTIWIALSKPTYGIHGTPEPSRIGKTSSAGCVRLTNWDAAELAKLVSPGVGVEFLE